jgi:hypothetical protein
VKLKVVHALVVVLACGSGAFAQEAAPVTSDQTGVQFSVGVGYLGNAGIGAQLSASNLLAPGVGLQLRAGLGVPVDGFSSQRGALELNAFLELDLFNGVTGRLALGGSFDFRSLWFLQGRLGLEYHPQFFPEEIKNLGVLAEFGISYRYPRPGETNVTDGNSFSFAAGLTWRF